MKFACVFPGQGSQSVGMLDALAENRPQVRDLYAIASEILGEDLWQVVSEGPAEALNRTELTQPAMLVAGFALWNAWRDMGGPIPSLLAGHSLGEYTALVCAGALDFGEAVDLVATRARLMQAAVPEGEGAMAALLGLDDDAVRQVCEAAAQGQVVEPVNFNSPGQVVIAGQRAAVERAMEQARAAGAKRALLLPVSVPSHCSLMRPAADKLAEKLAGVHVHRPEIPVVQNVDVQTHDNPDTIREALARQLYQPVRWVETIRAFADQGVAGLVELGPGKVLVGLNKRIEKKMAAWPAFDATTLQAALDGVTATGA